MRDWLTIELVVGTLLVSLFSSVGLLALWAATSSRHWFLRASVLLAALSPLLLVPAYEPLLILALEAATVALGVKLWQWLAKTNRVQGTIHFSLKSLLLLTPIVAVVTAIGTRIVVNMERQTLESWITITLNGMTSAVVVLLAAWIIVSTRRTIAWPIAAMVCLVLAATLAWFDWLFPTLTQFVDVGWPPDARMIASAVGAKAHPQLAWFVILPAVMLLALMGVALCLMAFAPAAARAARPQSRPSLSPRLAASATAILLALIAAFPLFTLWKLLNPPAPLSFATPNPNGFERITAASRELTLSPILMTNIRPQTTAQLAAEVAKYASGFEQLRLGLSQDVRVREWPDGRKSFPKFNWSNDTAQRVTRQAARALWMEAELAQRQNRHADAVRISRDILRLGAATSRDGTFVDYIVGRIALESMAHNSLYPSVAHLSPDECRAAITMLLDFDRAREPLEQVLERDRIWNQNALGWHGHLWHILEEIAPLTARNQAIREAIQRSQAVRQLLITELAIRAYQVEHGALPNSLADLTQTLRGELLVDPFDASGRTFRYVRTGDSYLLYSVGNDGQDNQGRANGPKAGISHDDQDLRLDVFLKPDDRSDVATADTPGGTEDAEKQSEPASAADKVDMPARN